MIQFIAPRTLAKLIANNHSYYRRFCAEDWKARGATDLNHYMSQVLVASPTAAQRRRLTAAAKQVRADLADFHTDWFDGKVFTKLPFRIGTFVGKTFENGLPHTIDDTILFDLNELDGMSDRAIVRMLKHEQVHVFQRKFPKYARNYLRSHNFRRVKKHTSRDGIRANPDTDGVIYERYGRVYALKWASKVTGMHSTLPRGVHPRYEHPYEDMAYRLEKHLKENSRQQ
jgi:hypothetical protein